MEIGEAKHVAKALAYEWLKSNLPFGQLGYPDYVKVIEGLHVVTGDVDRTTHIVSGILHQAWALNHSSDWVEAELRFEAQAKTFGDRTKWMRIILAAQDVTDAALDLYNERLNRFS